MLAKRPRQHAGSYGYSWPYGLFGLIYSFPRAAWECSSGAPRQVSRRSAPKPCYHAARGNKKRTNLTESPGRAGELPN